MISLHFKEDSNEQNNKKTEKRKIKRNKLFGEFIRIKNHFFKDINSRLKGVKDNRHQSYIEYSTDILLFTVIMKNVIAIESMNKMTTEFNKDESINNIAKTLGYDELEELPH